MIIERNGKERSGQHNGSKVGGDSGACERTPVDSAIRPVDEEQGKRFE